MNQKPLTEAQLALLNILSRNIATVLDGRKTRAATNLALMLPPLTRESKGGWILTASGEKRRAKETAAKPAVATAAPKAKAASAPATAATT